MPESSGADPARLGEAGKAGWPRLILLMGPPASGKDTLSAEIESRTGGRIVQFRKVRDSEAGLGRHYRIVTPGAFDEMIDQGRFLQWHGRYGRRYGVLRDEVAAQLEAGISPLIHVGRASNLQPFLESDLPCTIGLLWASRRTILDRLVARHEGDKVEICARYRAYVQERADIRRAGQSLAIDFLVDTGALDREQALLTLVGILASLAQGTPHPKSLKAWDAIRDIR